MAVMCLAVVACSGCAAKSNKWSFASWDVRKAVGLKKEPERPEPQIPVRMVTTWADTTLTRPGETPQRGFGGRISFFGRNSDDPVRVEGELVVYAFDETSRPPHETQPTRKYIFPAEEFARHESESALGPSYSFWLPWDEVGGEQKKISLIARFQPKEGPIVLSEQTRHLLPGPVSPLGPTAGPLLADGQRSALVNSIRTASYAGAPGETSPAETPPASTQNNQDGAKRMSTATIPLPQRLSETVKQPSPQISRRAEATLPLSQLAALKSGPTGDGNGDVAVMAGSAPAESSPLIGSSGAGVQLGVKKAVPRQSVTVGRRAESESLRDSLLETLPVRARQAGQPVRGHVP